MGVKFENVVQDDGTEILRAVVSKVNSPGLESAYIKGDDGKWDAPDDVRELIEKADAEQNPGVTAPKVQAAPITPTPGRNVYGQKGGFEAPVTTPVVDDNTESSNGDNQDGDSKN